MAKPTKHDKVFSNGNKAYWVQVSAGTPARDIWKALDIGKPKALMLVFGADKLSPLLKQHLAQLFTGGIARAAADSRAIIMDRGIKAGVMELIGQSNIELGWQSLLLGVRPSLLLGVAPCDKVSGIGPQPQKDNAESAKVQKDNAESAKVDPNHSHFVLVEGNKWVCATQKLSELANALADRTPILAILANGDADARHEVLCSVRHGWPLVVIEGSNGLADEICEHMGKSDPNDKVIAEIIDGCNIQKFPRNGSPEHLRTTLCQLIERRREEIDSQTSVPVLTDAWKLHTEYSKNAKQHKKTFNRIQVLILAVGILATLLVLTQKELNIQNNYLHNIIILLPITISALVAWASRFKYGNKWILFRGATEAIKREIYTFRARAGQYSEKLLMKESPEAVFAKEIEQIDRRLMRTEANLSALKTHDAIIPAREGDENMYSRLTGRRYLKVRLCPQLRWFQDRTAKLERELKLFQGSIYLAGAFGTFIAALGFQLWVAFTTSLAGVFATYLGYRTTEATLRTYNQTATDLANLQKWWASLSAIEKDDDDKVDLLVRFTEKILKNELAGWAQQMDDSLAKLYAEQEQAQTGSC